MQHKPHLLLLLPLLLPLCGHADDLDVTKIVDKKGFLTGVTIKTPDLSLHVSLYGNLEPPTPNKKKISNSTPAKRKKAPPLKITYYPKSGFDGNGGKIAKVNDIRIIYYPCTASNGTITIGNDFAKKHPLPENFPLTYNKGYKFRCSSPNGNGGKVNRIGSLAFSYYPSNAPDHNAGKLQRVGRYTFSYYGLDSFTGKAGQLKNV